MAATFNPQAAADQARNAYRNVTVQLGLLALDTAIPEAEKTVGQTREAYDRSKDALEASIATFERSSDAAGWGAAAFNHKIIDIAQRNVIPASTWPTAWRALRTSPRSWNCRRPIGASSSAH